MNSPVYHVTKTEIFLISFAFFSEADATKAMTKDRQNMQHRYVELFYTPPPSSEDRGSGRGRFPRVVVGYYNVDGVNHSAKPLKRKHNPFISLI